MRNVLQILLKLLSQYEKTALCFIISNVLSQTLTSLTSLHWFLKIRCFYGKELLVQVSVLSV